jgi:hypothetical protein
MPHPSNSAYEITGSQGGDNEDESLVEYNGV